MPLYYQLQEVLEEQIESGAWSPGEALPSEPELARRFGISRVVVRQALAILRDDRQIVRAPVFLAVCTECRCDGGETGPFEVARVEYRGDVLRFRLEVSASRPDDMHAIWEPTDPALTVRPGLR